MKRIYTTANGKRIDIDAIISSAEDTIAVGNMNVNARGDKLGPGGVVEVPKSKVMADYYKLHTPVAVDTPIEPAKREVKKDLVDDWIEPAVPPAPVETPTTSTAPLRGTLAGSVSKNKPADKEVPKKTGPSRI